MSDPHPRPPRPAGHESRGGPAPPPKGQPFVVEWISGSVEETRAFGERLGGSLKAGDVLALHGELGTGKTTLIQGLARGLGIEPGLVKSPTFVLMREYPGKVPLIHVDGYRLAGPAAGAWLDLDTLFSPKKITVLEWAERFAGLLPEDRVEVRLCHVSANRRRIALSATGGLAQEIIAQSGPNVSGQQPDLRPRISDTSQGQKSDRSAESQDDPGD